MINNDSLILGHATVKKTNIVFAITNIFIISNPESVNRETKCLSKIDWWHRSEVIRLKLCSYLRLISNNLQSQNSTLRLPRGAACSHLLRRFDSLPMRHSDDYCWCFYLASCLMFSPFPLELLLFLFGSRSLLRLPKSERDVTINKIRIFYQRANADAAEKKRTQKLKFVL